MALILVRVHGYTGAALLALSAPFALLAAAGIDRSRELLLLSLLGGFTMLLQAVAFWYFPSFAKREVVFEGMASYSGVILFFAAILGAGLRLGGLGVVAPAFAIAIFGLVLLASGLVGKRWRSGIPFWRVAGPFRVGDTAAMLTLATGALWSLAAGLLGLAVPTMLAALWPVGLLLLTLGALAHYVPRNRGRVMLVLPYLAGVALFVAGATLHMWAQYRGLVPDALASWLLLGLPLAGLSLAAPVATKRAGARMREAAPFLAASIPMTALAVALRLVGLKAAFVYASYFAWLAALGFALAGLVLLTLPVVFNQRPAKLWLWPSWGTGLVGMALLAAGVLTNLPRWPGAALLALSLLLWLAMLSPLRMPRRDCPTEPGEPS